MKTSFVIYSVHNEPLQISEFSEQTILCSTEGERWYWYTWKSGQENINYTADYW